MLLTTENLRQFSQGFNILLPFEFKRAATLDPIHQSGDDWEVRIIKPRGGGMLVKTTGLTFPDSERAEISVPIAPLDLDRQGKYYFQVIKTTGGIAVKSSVGEFEVKASLPTGLPVAPAVSPLQNFFPMFGAAGEAIQSPLKYNSATQQLELNGSPLGDGGGMSIGGAIAGAIAGSVLFVNSSNQLAQDNSKLFWDDAADQLRITSSSSGGGLHLQNAPGEFWSRLLTMRSQGFGGQVGWIIGQGEGSGISLSLVGDSNTGDYFGLGDGASGALVQLFMTGATYGTAARRARFNTSAPGTIGVQIKLASSQTADALQVINNSDANIFRVDSSGQVHVTSRIIGLNNLTISGNDTLQLMSGGSNGFPNFSLGWTRQAICRGIAAGVARPVQITSDQNNYAPDAESWAIFVSGDAARSITGLVQNIQGATNQTEGLLKILVNVGSFNLTLAHESASSSAANRFLCSTGSDIVLAPNQAADLIYDGTINRWRVFKRN